MEKYRKADWPLLIWSIVVSWTFGFISIGISIEHGNYEAALVWTIVTPISYIITISIMYLLGACEIEKEDNYAFVA